MNKLDLIIKKAITQGGSTLKKDLSNAEFKEGYMYSLVGKEKTYKPEDREAIKKTIEEYQKSIKSNQFIGLWIDKGLFYIDISQHELNKSRAIKKGKINMQLAIYDISNNKSIYLKDNYYILYNYNNNNNDITYLKEFKTYQEIQTYLKEAYNIKSNLSNYITLTLDNLKVINNLVIYKSIENIEY